MVLIAPSLLSADFSRLKEEITALEKAGADMIHLDIMDGHFVPNLTFGAPIIKSIRPITNLPFDAHLMVQNPENLFESLAHAGVNCITIHAEAVTHLDRVLTQIKTLGLRAGVALNPSTDENKIKYVLDKLDLVLVMTVNPGFGGQSFIQSGVTKIERLKKMTKDYSIKIEVDGGINPLTAAACISAGADILVAGTAVFKTNDYQTNIQALR